VLLAAQGMKTRVGRVVGCTKGASFTSVKQLQIQPAVLYLSFPDVYSSTRQIFFALIAIIAGTAGLFLGYKLLRNYTAAALIGSTAAFSLVRGFNQLADRFDLDKLNYIFLV
jgi:ABC-type transporter Mla maintaining outer membrane lipid asymmetry permease subunit MlaE